MKHLRKTAAQCKALIFAFVLMGLVQTFLMSFGARYFQTVIDNFTGGVLTTINITVYGAAMLSLHIVGYLHEYPWRKLEHGIVLRLKTSALRKVAVIDYLAYAGLGTGTLLQRIESGAAAGGNMLFGFYLRLASELLPGMLFSIIFVYAMNQTVMLAILCGYVVVFLITNLLLKFLYKAKEKILTNEEKLNHFLVRGLMEMVVFRVNRRFAREIHKAEEAADEIVSSRVKMSMIHEAFFAIFAVLIGFVKIGILVYGWTAKALTIGEIVALIALIDNAYTPIAIFNVLYIQYKLDKVTFARFAAFLDAPEDARLLRGNDMQEVKGSVTFSGVRFKYGDREALRDFSLEIERGRTVAFVGESGSGKSTAVKLLAGLLRSDEGNILVDGQNLQEVNLESYFRHIAYLPQEPSVFDGTLRENLVFDEDVDERTLIHAIRQVGLYGLCAKLENGLDTHLGERGLGLSGGERQQLALSRLFFSNASIVILDEATSAMDNLTEQAVMRNVMALLAGKTVIAIAHRLDSIKDFDEIIVFHEGRVVERGSFAELLKRHGVFYELYSRNDASPGA